MKNDNDNSNLDKQEIDTLIISFFNIFTNKNHRDASLQPNWSIIHSLCIPETIIIRKNGITEDVYNLTSFIKPRKKILTDGTLIDFEEKEIEEETRIIGNIAQRFSRYQKSGYLNGVFFEGFGNKFFQFVKTKNGWKINSLIWEDEI